MKSHAYSALMSFLAALGMISESIDGQNLCDEINNKKQGIEFYTLP